MQRIICEVCGRWVLKSEDVDSLLCSECEENILSDELRHKYPCDIE